MGEVERYPDGTFCWVDLGTADPAAAKAFYGGLLGWEFDDQPTGDRGSYTICRLDGKAVAGLYDRAEETSWGRTSKSTTSTGPPAGPGARRQVMAEPSTRRGAGGWPPSVTRRGRRCRCRGPGSSSRPRW
jgi:catechol 2,3-dioxygenase-like lactoylglutathione lyase family enzyme